jgi:acylpyruvate hydrolase
VRLVSFENPGGARPGRLRLGAVLPAGGPRAGDIIDLNRALAVRLASQDVGTPEAEADSLLPACMLGFLRQGARARQAAEQALAWALEILGSRDGPDLVRAAAVCPRRGVRLGAPISRPGKIIGVARNYAAHASERGQKSPPEEPVLFLKAASAVIGPQDKIILPAASRQVDYEGELAAVIGRAAHRVPETEAARYIAGYTVANDVTARDFQNVRGQHFIGKSCDTFAPMGPALVSADEVPDPQGLALRTTVGGQLRQSSDTGHMIFPVARLVAFASQLMTLEPGDVLLTGTPAGVGAAADPPRWLRDGDVVEVEIESLGTLRNPVISDTQTRDRSN